jgi:hypothetical protein
VVSIVTVTSRVMRDGVSTGAVSGLGAATDTETTRDAPPAAASASYVPSPALAKLVANSEVVNWDARSTNCWYVSVVGDLA